MAHLRTDYPSPPFTMLRSVLTAIRGIPYKAKGKNAHVTPIKSYKRGQTMRVTSSFSQQKKIQLI